MVRSGIIVGVAALAMSGCFRGKNDPGWAWFPDMAHSQAYETYVAGDTTLFPDGMAALAPVEGTIPRGYTPFHYPNTDAGRAAAGAELVNPVPLTKDALDNGKANYEIYCGICHGLTGEGDGYIVAVTEAFKAVPPSYFDSRIMALPDGDIFFTMHYGKGQMGSYASQLSQTQRWEILHYINSLQFAKAGGTAPPDSTTVQNAPQ